MKFVKFLIASVCQWVSEWEIYALLIIMSLNVACLLNHLTIYLFYWVTVALATLSSSSLMLTFTAINMSKW